MCENLTLSLFLLHSNFLLVYQCALTAKKREKKIYPILRMNRLLAGKKNGKKWREEE